MTLDMRQRIMRFRVRGPASACSSVALLAIHLHHDNAAVKTTGQVRPKSLPWPCCEHLPMIVLDSESMLEQVELQKVNIIKQSCSREMTLRFRSLSKSIQTLIAINAIQGMLTRRSIWPSHSFVGRQTLSAGNPHLLMAPDRVEVRWM